MAPVQSGKKFRSTHQHLSSILVIIGIDDPVNGSVVNATYSGELPHTNSDIDSFADDVFSVPNRHRCENFNAPTESF